MPLILYRDRQCLSINIEVEANNGGEGVCIVRVFNQLDDCCIYIFDQILAYGTDEASRWSNFIG